MIFMYNNIESYLWAAATSTKKESNIEWANQLFNTVRGNYHINIGLLSKELVYYREWLGYWNFAIFLMK